MANPDEKALDVEAIRARAEAATKGPWRQVMTVGGWPSGDVTSDPAQEDIAADCGERDGAFIANARADVPALCDEIARLRAELAEERRLRGLAQNLLQADLDAARRELEEARRLLRISESEIRRESEMLSANMHDAIRERDAAQARAVSAEMLREALVAAADALETARDELGDAYNAIPGSISHSSDCLAAKYVAEQAMQDARAALAADAPDERTPGADAMALLRELAMHTVCSAGPCMDADHYVELSDRAKRLVLDAPDEGLLPFDEEDAALAGCSAPDEGPGLTLMAALEEAIDFAEEGWAYASPYFRDKWRCDERLQELRACAARAKGRG